MKHTIYVALLKYLPRRENIKIEYRRERSFTRYGYEWDVRVIAIILSKHENNLFINRLKNILGASRKYHRYSNRPYALLTYNMIFAHGMSLNIEAILDAKH